MNTSATPITFQVRIIDNSDLGQMMARVSKVLELSFGPPISKHTFDIGQPHPKLEELFSSMQALSISSYIQSLLAALDSPNWFIPTPQQHLQEA